MTTRFHGLAYVLAATGVIGGCATRSAATSCRAVRICSFNVCELGSHPERRDLDGLADAVRGCDAVFVQEVRDRGGEEQIRRWADRLGHGWSAPTISAPAGHGERYAAIVRETVTIQRDFEPIAAPADLYARRPAALRLKAGDLDLVVVSVHLTWRNTERRAREVAHLLGWLRSDPYGPEERDILVVGDFNRYGKGGRGFEAMGVAAMEGYVRVYLEETHAKPFTDEAPVDHQSTTVGQRHWQYDQFVGSPGLSREFGAARAVFGKTVGVEAFDQKAPWSQMEHSKLRLAMSDHRPVWLRLCTDRGDDD